MLAEHFRIPPHLACRLTPRQKREVLFHRRDNKGRLVPPDVGGDEEMSPEAILAAVSCLQGVTPEQVRKLKEHYDGRHESGQP